MFRIPVLYNHLVFEMFRNENYIEFSLLSYAEWKWKRKRLLIVMPFVDYVFIIGCPLCLLQALSSMGCITINKSNTYWDKMKYRVIICRLTHSVRYISFSQYLDLKYKYCRILTLFIYLFFWSCICLFLSLSIKTHIFLRPCYIAKLAV